MNTNENSGHTFSEGKDKGEYHFIQEQSFQKRPQIHSVNKKYLGDGVYADFDGYHFVLTTENGIEATNRICIEPEVVISLMNYLTETADRMKR